MMTLSCILQTQEKENPAFLAPGLMTCYRSTIIVQMKSVSELKIFRIHAVEHATSELLAQ